MMPSVEFSILIETKNVCIYCLVCKDTNIRPADGFMQCLCNFGH